MCRKKITISRTTAFIAIFIHIMASAVYADLTVDSVYPTLGLVGQNLEEVFITGNGFDESTRVSMYQDAGNIRTIIGSGDTPGKAWDVAVVGNTAYVADRDSGLQVIDISTSSNPVIIGSKDTPGEAYGVMVVGDTAYVADKDSGLQVIDISTSSNPVVIGSKDTSGEAYDVTVVGETAYVADGSSGLQIIDVSSPATPVIIGSKDTPGEAWGVAVVDDTAYVADNESGLQIIDVSNPSTPVIIGSVDTPGLALGVTMVGDTAYVADGLSGLQVIDVSNPATPVIISNVDTPGGPTFDVTLVGDTAYVADYVSGLQIIDISNPATPVIIGSVDTPGNTLAVTIVGDKAYMADQVYGLQIINVSNPVTPVIIGTVDTPGDALDVTVVGDTAYVADWASGLQVIDVSNPATPAIIGSVDINPSAWGVAVAGGKAYVAAWSRGLQVIDVSNPATPAIIGSVDTPGNARGVTVVGDTAYVADLDFGLQVIDVSNPATPVIIGSVDTPGSAFAVAVVDNTAYVADKDYGLQVIDVSNPATPAIIGSVDTPATARGVAVAGDTAYVADYYAGLQVIDVSNPATPVIIGSVDLPGRTSGVTVLGDTAYMADRDYGLQVIDVSNPATPVVIGSVNTAGSAWGVMMVGDKAYVADGYGGFTIVPLPTEITPITVNSATSISVTLPSQIITGHRYSLRIFNGTESDELPGAVSFVDDSDVLKSKAIIVAGGGPNASGGTIWEETKKCANKAYDALILQGYEHDSIHYISMEAGNNYIDQANPSEFLSDLSNAINIWATDASQLLLFFVDHGEKGKLVLFDNGVDIPDKLAVSVLDEWLDTLQDTMTGPVTFIYDACESGSFISKMNPDGKERIIITSSSEEPAYFLGSGDNSFSFQFWDNTIKKSGRLGSAFLGASNFMKTYQSARIEADWDLDGDEDQDIEIAEDKVVRRGSSVFIGLQPFISSVSPPKELEGLEDNSATIWASGVIDAVSVWAHIIPPNVNPETSGIPIDELPTVQLTYSDNDSKYMVDYHNFNKAGTYVIVIKAKSTHEIYSYVNDSMISQTLYSPSMYTYVTKTIGEPGVEADSYEVDDTFNQANVIVLDAGDPQAHNFHEADDADWVKFYGLSGELYKVKASGLGITCDVVIEVFDSDGNSVSNQENSAGAGEDEFLEWTCPQAGDGVYYIKISNANSTYGENVKYELKVYRPIGVLQTLLRGIVTDDNTGHPIGNALITTSAKASALTFAKTSVGRYLMSHMPGSFSFTISAEDVGYPKIVYSDTQIEETFSMTLDFTLEPDSDGDGVIDDNDGCPDDPDKIQPEDCGCNVIEIDTDKDGTADCIDQCSSDPLKTSPGTCGCGISDIDSDNDGIPDCNDNCDNNIDTDNDGTGDCDDGCPNDKFKTSPGTCGCGVSEADEDSDGTPDCQDNCPSHPLKTNPGVCGCTIPDIDTDGDTTPDCNDTDDDNDGVLDGDDDLPLDGTETVDTDQDGTGDNADTDDDNDGISDSVETAGPNEGDFNNDGILDSLQNNVVSMKSNNAQGYIALETPSGTFLSNCQAVENPSPDDTPANLAFDYGFFDFTISGLTPGDSASLTMTLPTGVVADTYYKYGQTPDNPIDHWYEFLFDGNTGAEIEGNVITLHFIDAVRGDDELVQDDMVVDLGAPGFTTTTDADDGKISDSSGGGGGCFLSTIFN